MKTMFLTAAFAAFLAASPAYAQTASEDLQRAIFAEDAQGNIDGAIQLYRQVANSSFAPRDVSAHAQYRLSLALLQKGDLAAATREMERLEKAFAEYRTLVVNLTDAVRKASTAVAPAAAAAANGQSQAVGAMAAELGKLTFDAGPGVTVRGSISMVQWTSATVFMIVQSEGQRYAVILAAPNLMLSTGTITRKTFQLGEKVAIDARHPYQEPKAVDGVLGVRAQTISNGNGAVVFSRSALPVSPLPEQLSPKPPQTPR